MRTKYSPEHIQFIKDNYLLVSTDLAVIFNAKFSTTRTPAQMHSLRKRLGLRTGRTGVFEPGNVPSPKAFENRSGSSTSFKKGNRPHNALPVGSEVITSDGYRKVKLEEPNIWEFKHIIVWSQKNKRPGIGENITFIDGDPLNCDVENLQLFSRAECLFLNQHGYKDLDPTLRPTLVATAKLSVKMHSLIKESA